MHFQIPFDAVLTRSQYELQFKRTFAANLKKNTRAFILGVIFTLLGVVQLGTDSPLAPWFLAAGIFYLYHANHYYQYYRKTKKANRGQVNELVSLREAAGDVTTWEFNAHNFRYKDLQYDFSYTWDAFQHVYLVGDQLFLPLKNFPAQAYILGKQEIGEDAFKEVILFLTDKRLMEGRAGEPA